MGIYCIGIPGIGIGAMALSFFLAFLQVWLSACAFVPLIPKSS
jgi:hypothetical protein